MKIEVGLSWPDLLECVNIKLVSIHNSYLCVGVWVGEKNDIDCERLTEKYEFFSLKRNLGTLFGGCSDEDLY